MKPGLDDLPGIAADLEDKHPQEILRWAWETYGAGLTMATAFQAAGCAMISMLSEITKKIYIFNLETGYQFPETLETRRRIVEKYGIPVHLIRAEDSVDQMEARLGGPIYSSNPDLCCHLRKVVPMRQAIQGRDAWITAIRRDQTSERTAVPVVGWDAKFNMVKVNPVARWTNNEVWEYVLANDVPYNPLHDQGYPSIGCWPCTRSVGEGERDRDGRWSGLAKKECGLHVANSPVKL